MAKEWNAAAVQRRQRGMAAVRRAGFAPRTPARILLISRIIDSRERYAQALRAPGYCTLQAASITEACRLAQELTPVLVIADIDVSVGDDGVSLSRKLRQDAELQEVPLVILAGPSDGRHPARRAGRHVFILPPGDAAALERDVSRLLKEDLAS